jgi:hypothetical protein
MGSFSDGARAAEVVEIRGGKARTCGIDLDASRFELGGKATVMTRDAAIDAE